MKERALPCVAHEVRAILDGRMTVMRRLIQPAPATIDPAVGPCWDDRTAAEKVNGSAFVGSYYRPIRCPFGAPGDRLWVRETFWQVASYPGTTPCGEPTPLRDDWGSKIHYAADSDPENTPNRHYPNGLRNGAIAAPDPYAVWLKRPSCHMQRSDCRIILEVVSVRAERLQDITDDDIRAEGVTVQAALDLLGERGRRRLDGGNRMTLRDAWRVGWDAINGKRAPWSSNPLVWRSEFKRVEVAS